MHTRLNQNKALKETNFRFPGQTGFYRGKVRDVYTIGGQYLIMIASDRISAFDVVLPAGIPFKGQVLNQTATFFLNSTKVPNWLIQSPDPNVAIGKICEPYKVEMVIRGYLVGHAAREYKAGRRSVCGVSLPNGLKENDRLPEPIITPTTKASEGHDQDISREEILRTGIVDEEEYDRLETYTRMLFHEGSLMAAKQGLILADTKYEFGKSPSGEILLIDEIHTPDSSRYFYLEGFDDRQKNGEAQKQLSKEFVRQWLIQNGFQGLPGQSVPAMDEDFIHEISSRYIELYEKVTGMPFLPRSYQDIEEEMQNSIINFLNNNYISG